MLVSRFAGSLAGELELTVGIEPEGHVAHLQELGLGRLLTAAHPELHGIVIVFRNGQRRGVDADVVAAIEGDGLVLVVQIPCLVRHRHVAAAGIVANALSLAFVHLPIADKVACSWVLRHGTVGQSGGQVVGLVPEQQLVHGSRGATAYAKRAVADVCGHFLVVEQRDGLVGRGHSGAQFAIGGHVHG